MIIDAPVFKISFSSLTCISGYKDNISIAKIRSYSLGFDMKPADLPMEHSVAGLTFIGSFIVVVLSILLTVYFPGEQKTGKKTS